MNRSFLIDRKHRVSTAELSVVTQIHCITNLICQNKTAVRKHRGSQTQDELIKKNKAATLNVLLNRTEMDTEKGGRCC